MKLVARKHSPPDAASDRYDAEWYWEGNVQQAIADHLAAEGWTIEHFADTAKHQRGDDIRARRGGRTLRVEVKGWPTTGQYADSTRAGQVKRTQPSTQAGHWYGDGLLKLMRDLHEHPGDQVAIGLPDRPRYRRLVSGSETPLRRLGIGAYLVAQGPSVVLLLPLGSERDRVMNEPTPHPESHFAHDPEFTVVGDLSTAEGLLAYLSIQSAPHDTQVVAVRAFVKKNSWVLASSGLAASLRVADLT